MFPFLGVGNKGREGGERPTPNNDTHGPRLDQRTRKPTRQVRVQIIRRDIIITEVRLRPQRDYERDRNHDQRHREAYAHVMPVALLLGQDDEGQEQKRVEDQTGDGDVIGDVGLRFEGVGVDPVGCGAREAAFDGVVGEGEVGAEAVGDVCFIAVSFCWLWFRYALELMFRRTAFERRVVAHGEEGWRA